jgi:hypothetical protein
MKALVVARNGHVIVAISQGVIINSEKNFLFKFFARLLYSFIKINKLSDFQSYKISQVLTTLIFSCPDLVEI